jgi:dTDP-4-amino-4,6-dideoxygalactose transaminase
MSDLTDELSRITGRSIIKMTPNGNKAIRAALVFAKQAGVNKVLIQDQGGWTTYYQFPKKLGMEIVVVNTDCGLIDLEDLKAKAGKNSALLINSMPGYFAVQDMKPVAKICEASGCLLINDISGSVGTDESHVGDILVCSCGKWKPIEAGYGGFLATENNWFNTFESNFENKKTQLVLDAVEGLEYRRERLEEVTKQVKDDLSGMDIIHRDSKGINVIVRYADDSEKETIISYCGRKGYEFTLCPRYMRVNEQAVSIEVKRMK